MKLIDEWRGAWRFWSVRFALLPAAIAAALVANPSLVLGLIGFIPPSLQPVAAVLTFAVTFIVPALLRVMAQGGSDAGK